MAWHSYLKPLQISQAEPPLPPPLPPGRMVDVPRRGEMLVRELASARQTGGPTILLLHGWTLCADLNWFAMYSAIARHGRVLAMDVRGHGRGLRSEQRFTLEAAADDAAALLAHLGTGPAIVVGYSMGGSIGMLMWRRHPESVAGLVLQSTALQWRAAPHERILWSTMAGLEYVLRFGVPHGLAERYLRVAAERNPDLSPVLPWLKAEAIRGNPSDLAAAGRALSAFDARAFAPKVDVPTAVIVSMRDRLIRAGRQRELADAIPGATCVEVDAAHNGWLVEPDAVRDALESALGTVVEQLVPHQEAFAPLG
ncbi:MAG: alpha/beta fold hydrolase [Acidimicrobiales bacterium]